MPPLSLPALPSGTPTVWDEAIYAFLVEKRSRSGSTRTVESYARMLWPFFRATTPDQVRSADVLAYPEGRPLGRPRIQRRRGAPPGGRRPPTRCGAAATGRSFWSSFSPVAGGPR
jgi:hypothetical protein